MNILVVDNEDGFVITVARNIKCSSYALQFATTAEQAMKIINHHKRSSKILNFVFVGNDITLPIDDSVPIYYIGRRDKSPYIPLYHTKQLISDTLDCSGFKTYTVPNKNAELD